MLDISVRSRLIALVLGMAALLLLVGGLGFHASSSAVNELKEIYEHQTIPMRELGAMGYKYQFITLAGIHSMWYNMFDLAQDYAARGMSAYVEKVQEPEFAARDRGYTFVSHQQEVGTGYFDDVTTVIQGGKSSVTALTGSTEEEQFH